MAEPVLFDLVPTSSHLVPDEVANVPLTTSSRPPSPSGGDEVVGRAGRGQQTILDTISGTRSGRGLPQWLREHLAAIGRANPDGYRRAVKQRTCRDCDAVVLGGLDADRAALTVQVDPYEIDEIGIVLALTQGIEIYTLNCYAGNWQLDFSHIWSIQAGRKYPTLPAHRCGVELPPAARCLMRVGPAQAPLPDQPPF